ncbi:hypothetical protein ACFPRL_14505 [Pseudoclavibacter helvolus]
MALRGQPAGLRVSQDHSIHMKPRFEPRSWPGFRASGGFVHPERVLGSGRPWELLELGIGLWRPAPAPQNHREVACQNDRPPPRSLSSMSTGRFSTTGAGSRHPRCARSERLAAQATSCISARVVPPATSLKPCLRSDSTGR